MPISYLFNLVAQAGNPLPSSEPLTWSVDGTPLNCPSSWGTSFFLHLSSAGIVFCISPLIPQELLSIWSLVNFLAMFCSWPVFSRNSMVVAGSCATLNSTRCWTSLPAKASSINLQQDIAVEVFTAIAASDSRLHHAPPCHGKHLGLCTFLPFVVCASLRSTLHNCANTLEYFLVLAGSTYRVLGLVVLSTLGDRRCVWEYVEAGYL